MTDTTVHRRLAPQLLLLAGKTRTYCATSTRRAGALPLESDFTLCGAWSALFTGARLHDLRAVFLHEIPPPNGSRYPLVGGTR
ncbi:MAG: hypothetical protein QM730_04130 [Anaerolineales bacterium]